jgi:hypothetical protein
MKKIIAISLVSLFAVLVNAQQNNSTLPSKAGGVNPNIERMRIVNEKIAAEKAARKTPEGPNREAIAQQKAANRANSKAAQPSGSVK